MWQRHFGFHKLPIGSGTSRWLVMETAHQFNKLFQMAAMLTKLSVLTMLSSHTDHNLSNSLQITLNNEAKVA